MEVFVVPYDKTLNIDNGFTKQNHSKKIYSVYNDIGKYVDKDIANKSAAMQQIIPYVLIRNEENKFLTASLTFNDKTTISIGFGNDNLIPIDGISENLFKGAVRTLFEDVMLESLKPMKFIGTVRDKVVNDKYLGYVFIIDDVKDVSLNNTNLTAKWMSTEELINNYSKMECWSKHIINYLVDHSL